MSGKLVTLYLFFKVTPSESDNVSHIKPYRRSKTGDGPVPRQDLHNILKENMTSMWKL